MRLIEMRVRNFRTIKGGNVRISFEGSDIIFLLGQNNAGKSTLLSAYELLINPKHKPKIHDFYGHKASEPIIIEGLFRKEPGDDEAFADNGLDKWVDTDGLLKFKVEWTTPDQVGQKYTFEPAKQEYAKNGFGGLDTIFMHHAPTPIRIPAMPSMDELSKWASDTFKTVAIKLMAEQEHDTYQQALEKVRALEEAMLSQEHISALVKRSNTHFCKVFPDIELQVTPKDGQEFDLSKLFDKRFDLGVKDNRLPTLDQHITSQGHGVIRLAMFNVLGLLKDLDGKTDKKAFLLLFEEPEIYLHPHKLHLLRRCLYELCADSPFQALCASHSPALIDISRPHTSLVRIARDSNGITRSYQIGEDVFQSDDNRKQHVQMVNRFNPHICEAFFADEVVLVEGDTETIVLRELLEKHALERDIFVLNTGSKNNIPFFQEVLTHFRIKQHVLHDCDSKYLPAKEGGKPRKNSAWVLNDSIWQWVVKAQEIDTGLSRRYVFGRNFESAHDYVFDPDKGKPLSAYEFARALTLNDSGQPVINFLLQILNNKGRECEFTPEDLLDILEKTEKTQISMTMISTNSESTETSA
ncbi:ATP-dependent endonuclease [Vampirovibrio sp.]|uniref:ATP-dependent nuclease n=1 Tax=Vampirovibrio sp. TaxID=2717857 RepID=UPI0035942BE3